MLPDWAIFLYIQAVFVSIAAWESHIDPEGWAKTGQGWRIKIGARELTGYHFWCWLVMLPLLLLMPLAIYGWDKHLFIVLAVSAFIGIVIEDFLWFVFNPKFTVAKWNSEYAKWHWWIKIGKFEIPEFYILLPIVAILIWYIFLL